MLTLSVLLIGLFLLVPQSASAAGGVGSGGSGGGGSSGGPWGWTTYGHGWARYLSSGSGPSDGFNTGSWAAAKSACNGFSTYVAVNVIGTGKAPGTSGYPSATGDYMAYNWTGFSGVWGSGGTVDHGTATKISVATAQAAFGQLGSYGVSTSGYTFGSNVAWFCYGIFNTTVRPVVTPAASSIVRGSQATFTLKRTVVNYTAPAKTAKYSISYRFNNTGAWLNIPTSVTTVYDNTITTPLSLTIGADLTAAAITPNLIFPASFIPASANSICVQMQFVNPVPTHVVYASNPASACTSITTPAPTPWTITAASQPVKNNSAQAAGSTIHVAPGDVIKFRHTITNSSSSATVSPNINYVGVNTTTGPMSLAAGSVPALNVGQTSAALTSTSYTVVLADVGKTFCQALSYNPTSSSNNGASQSNDACIIVDAPAVSCTQSLSISPTRLQPGDVADITLRFPAAAGGQTLNYTISGGLGSASGVAIAGGQTTYVINNVTMPNTADDYDASWTVSGATGTCTGTVSVVDMPYYSVTGIGVRTGGDFSGSCTGGGLLAGWHNYGGGSNYGYGAGGTLSAIATIAITGYASAMTPGSTSPTDLTFANTSTNTGVDSPTLGGSYGGSYCFSEPKAPSSGTQVASSSIDLGSSDGAYTYNGNLSLNGASLPNNVNVSLFVNGNVYIKGNITISDSGRIAQDDISSLVIVADNIFIDDGVHQLDGLYVANGSAGDLFTCANGFAPEVVGNLYGTCNDQLVVHGSFVAKHVHLMRTYGTLKDASNPASPCHNKGTPAPVNTSTCAGEVFEFSPEMYLTNPAIKPQSNGAVHYDSIVNLAPIL